MLIHTSTVVKSRAQIDECDILAGLIWLGLGREHPFAFFMSFFSPREVQEQFSAYKFSSFISSSKKEPKFFPNRNKVVVYIHIL